MSCEALTEKGKYRKMKKELKWAICIFSFLYFLCLAIALKVKDVQIIGPYNVEIGLASVNAWFRKLCNYDNGIGYSAFWYYFSQVMVFLAMALSLFWIGLGVYQYSKDRDSSDIDKSLIATYGLYILALLFFLIYRKLSINNGPVPLPGKDGTGVSFPSFHAMLFLVAMGSTIYLSGYFLEDHKVSKKLILMIRIFFAFLMVLGIFARIISGVEWITDLLGGICFTVPLLVIYSFFCDV